MKHEPAFLQGAYIIELDLLQDERGWFARTFDKNEFNTIGFNAEWVQCNHSFTKNKGAVRGMHYQLPPFAEIKLVRCIAGAVFDVIIDLRKNSETFLQWFGIELSAENKKMLYIPQGFAHGFQTLSDNAELIYNHSQFYKPDFESGIKYDDPMINIEWTNSVTDISEKDKNRPYLTKTFEGIKF